MVNEGVLREICMFTHEKGNGCEEDFTSFTFSAFFPLSLLTLFLPMLLEYSPALIFTYALPHPRIGQSSTKGSAERIGNDVCGDYQYRG